MKTEQIENNRPSIYVKYKPPNKDIYFFEGELIEIKARKSRIGTSSLTLMDDGCEDLNEINTISLK